MIFLNDADLNSFWTRIKAEFLSVAETAGDEASASADEAAASVKEAKKIKDSIVAPTIEIGTTSTLAPGSSATVENVGDAVKAKFNFGIPKGDPGDAIDSITGIKVDGTLLSVDNHNVDIDMAGATVKNSTGLDNILLRSTAYAVGTIKNEPTLPNGFYLRCVVAGTTASVSPDYTTVSGGGTISDGSCTLECVTYTNQEYIDALIATKEQELTMTLQTGEVTLTGSNSWATVNVTFPKAFKTVPMISIFPASGFTLENSYASNITTTGMKITQWCTSSGFLFKTYWQALGYIE